MRSFIFYKKRSILLILLFLLLKCKNDNSNVLTSLKLDKLRLQKEYSFKFPDTLNVNGFYLAQIKLNNNDTEYVLINRKKGIIIIFNKDNSVKYKKCPVNVNENFLIKIFEDLIISFSYYDNKFNIWNNDFIRFYKLHQLNDSFQYIPINLNLSDTLYFFYRLIRYYNEKQFYNYYNKGFYPLIFVKSNGNILKENNPVQIIPIKYFLQINKNKNMPNQRLNLTFKGNNLFIENSYSEHIFSYNILTNKSCKFLVKNNPFIISPRFYNKDTSKLDQTVLIFNVYNSMNKVYDLVFLENKKIFFRTIKLSDSLRLKINREMVYQLIDTNFRVFKNFILVDSINEYITLPFEHIGKIYFCRTNYKENAYEIFAPVFN